MIRNLIIVLVIASLVGISHLLSGQESASKSTRRALLIGVTRYPSLAEKYHLSGPANDVLLMQQLLVTKKEFAFSPNQIKVLSEKAGERDPNRLPTRANIERAFADLAAVAEEGDEIVVFMAGHGAQQPEHDKESPTETDGLDEIFLPRDIAKWDSDQLKVPNAISDDEIGNWLKAIRAKNARLWVVFDCCHSGDMTRGFGETERFVNAEDKNGLGMPSGMLVKARELAKTRINPGEIRSRGYGTKSSSIDIQEQAGMAFLYACQAREKAVEKKLPTEANGKTYGLLTYSLNSVLSKMTGRLSYKELEKRIHYEYVHHDHPRSPTPLVGGGDVKRDILGQETISRPAITVKLDDLTRELTIDAGQLQGITKGTVLAAYQPFGPATLESAEPIGYMRVTEAGIAEAIVTPIAFQNAKQPRKSALNGGRCEIIEKDFGDLQIAVAVAAKDFDDSPVPQAELRPLQQLVEKLAAGKDKLVSVAAGPGEADWFMRIHAGNLYLVPSSEWSQTTDGNRIEQAPMSRGMVFGPFQITAPLPATIGNSLFKIARAENLLRLATANASSNSGQLDERVDVRMNVELRQLLTKSEQSAQFQPGDRIQFTVTNHGRKDLDLTVLYIDSQMGISAIFPRRGRNNRIERDTTLEIPSLTFTDDTLGREHFIFIAVHASGPPVNFTRLAQSTIPAVERGSTDPTGLNALLKKALYGQGQTRSAGIKQIESYQFEVVSVDVVPSVPMDE